MKEQEIKELAKTLHKHDDENCEVCSTPEKECFECEAEYLLDTGYRNVGEMKLISDEEINKDCLETNPCRTCELANHFNLACGYTHRGLQECPASRLYKAGAQAQLNADRKDN